MASSSTNVSLMLSERASVVMGCGAQSIFNAARSPNQASRGCRSTMTEL